MKFLIDIFRISFATVEAINTILTALVQRMKPEEFDNSIVIIDDQRVRVRRLHI